MATGMEGMDLGAEGWLVTGHPHSGSREKIGSETVLQPFKLFPSDLLPPVRLHLHRVLEPFKTASPPGNQNTLAYGQYI